MAKKIAASAHQELIERFVVRKKKALDGQDHVRAKLKTVLKECGWARTSATNCKRIQKALVAAGIYPEPILDAEGVQFEDWIYSSQVKPKPYKRKNYSKWAFASEETLRRFLLSNFDRIKQFKRLKKPQREYKLPSGRRVDILCRERKSNDYVVIEIKKDNKDPIGQLLLYLREVNEKLAKAEDPPVKVRGMVISGQPNRAFKKALGEELGGYAVAWHVYRVQMKLY